MTKFTSLPGGHTHGIRRAPKRLHLVMYTRLPSTHLPVLPCFTPTARCMRASVVLRSPLGSLILCEGGSCDHQLQRRSAPLGLTSVRGQQLRRRLASLWSTPLHF
ncbi:hypothetical protein FIBSPDRAFT_250000 [Athelia psychrophila]|uniref:Uncharacterized protein n=1 Tax=Athelia psychrophila TaxID=1759441 RepID=A0A165XWQ1_9AGAM|nr:hypothetical protein FIBSPDRAFT_250000 [Fibularhizoctonia sp. CBS 109695]